MPRGPKGQKRPADVIGNAVKVMQIATGEVEEEFDDGGKDKAAQALGRKGGLARAGVDGNVSPHWLRHAHASHALERGAPVALVRDTLGHSSVSTTNGYLHARPNDSSARYLAV